MFDVVHYVSGGAAGGSLRALCKCRPADWVVEILDPLAIGPLRDIDQPAGLRERTGYLRRLFERIGEMELYASLATGIGLPELGAARPDAARALVWCGPDADEQLLLRAACAGWGDRPLWVVAVGAATGGTVPHRAVGACSLDELRVAEQCARRLSDTARAALAADWERLLRTDQRLRIREGDQIVGCDEDLFDPRLLATCPGEFASAARVVGQVMAESPHLIGDSFLDYRLRELIALG
ncbi:MAG: DUF1835 domain-containing protein, partial [Chromatiaceae bacterium]|nr:DUF1835 domain-containing protein [Chromatiaceae bacterium]